MVNNQLFLGPEILCNLGRKRTTDSDVLCDDFASQLQVSELMSQLAFCIQKMLTAEFEDMVGTGVGWLLGMPY